MSTAGDSLGIVAELTPPQEWAYAVAATATIVAFVAMLAFGILLFRAGQLKHPQPLIISLSLLTGVALLGALIGHDSDAYNLAAVGIGALAGSLAAIYRTGNERTRKDDTDDDQPKDEET